jgi:hypothetical protein
MFRRQETPADDRARTDRFLDSLDADNRGDQLERIVFDAAAAEVTGSYPPPGHTYPRR